MSMLLSMFLVLALGGQEPTREVVELDGNVLGFDLCDLDGDGWRELVVARDEGLEVRALFRDGDPWSVPRGESRTLAWCSPQVGRGAESLYLIRDGGQVVRQGGSSAAAEVVVTDPAVSLPHGVFPARFAQDFRGTGQVDLVLPHRNGLKLYFGGAGGFQPGPRIQHRSGVSLRLPDGVQRPSRVVQDLRLPAFGWADRNGDGHLDLDFLGRDLVQCFWTDRDGNLPERPTLELDLQELRDQLGVSEDDFDPSNLFAGLSGMVTKELRDLDADGHTDLLLRQGSRVSVYAGTATGVDQEQARQVLKVSGNLLAAFAADENDDGRLDLCLLQISKVSLAEVLLWVVVGGSLDFELFAYHQTGAMKFDQRPSSRRTVTLDIPALRGMEKKMEAPMERMEEQLRSIPLPLDWDGDGRRDDVAILRPRRGDVDVYRDLTEDEIPLSFEHQRESNIARFDRQTGGGDSLQLSFEEFMDWMPFYGRELVEAAGGRSPTLGLVGGVTLPEEDDKDPVVLFRVGVNRDDRDDLVLVVANEAQGTVTLVFWVAPRG